VDGRFKKNSVVYECVTFTFMQVQNRCVNLSLKQVQTRGLTSEHTCDSHFLADTDQRSDIRTHVWIPIIGRYRPEVWLQSTRVGLSLIGYRPKVCHHSARVTPTYWQVQTRGLPADHVGAVRVVSIGGVDANLCCGTHVSNTAQLQTVKLLTAAPGKRSGSTCVTFVAGTRLRRWGAARMVFKFLSSISNKSDFERKKSLKKRFVCG
jgi:hypothetical protein